MDGEPQPLFAIFGGVVELFQLRIDRAKERTVAGIPDVEGASRAGDEPSPVGAEAGVVDRPVGPESCRADAARDRLDRLIRRRCGLAVPRSGEGRRDQGESHADRRGNSHRYQ